MAIILLPLNRIGLGHLSRAFAVAERLQVNGESPVIFAQGHYPEHMAAVVPGISVGTVYKATFDHQLDVTADVEHYALLAAGPGIVIEDSHPTPITLKPTIRRYLLVRPASIEYMRLLQRRYGYAYQAFLIADHPDSPTWPYTLDQSREIASWRGWTCVGPIFRLSNRRGTEYIRRKYGVESGINVFVFSMGGGGVQDGAPDDISSFCSRSLVIAEAIRRMDPGCRLLFVRGPLFPREKLIPAIFEDVASEPDMPSLLAVATGAVVRPGYNTIWECIMGGTAFLPLEGTTFEEPVADRLRRLRGAGLIPANPIEWIDRDWRNNFKLTSRRMRKLWDPSLSAEKVCRTVLDGGVVSAKSRVFVARPVVPRSRGATYRRILLARIDDVAEADDDLLDVLEICASRGLHVSLEVIPYLCRVDEIALRKIAGRSLRFEVSQHGYAHLPRRNLAGRRVEFPETYLCEHDLVRGLRIMQSRFPTTFHGGFSAPYDVAHASVYSTWYQLGGRYASVSQGHNIPRLPRIVQLMGERWDWSQDMPYSADEVVEAVTWAIQERGIAGLVFHPRLLRHPGERVRLEALVDRILALGGRPALISEVAGRIEGRTSTSSSLGGLETS
jgi:hypothetical protein